MKLCVVRHCSTVCSEQKIFCGSTDIPLSPRGEEEAEALAARVRSRAFACAFSSPLLRARQTAEAIIRGKNIPLFLDERLRERSFGAFEGTRCDRPDGADYRRNLALKYPGGESYLDVAARIYAFLGELKGRFSGEEVLVVSHGSACRVIRSYFRELTDGEFYSYSQPNASVEEYEL